MDKFDKTIVEYAIAGLYRSLCYGVETIKQIGHTMIKIFDWKNKDNATLVISVSVDNLLAVICCDEYDFAVDIIDRLANLMHIKLIKVKNK